MEKCLFNGEILYACDYKKYDNHKKFKLASERKELSCIECGEIVNFQDYTKRSKHFAHLPGTAKKCDYNEYAKILRKRSSVWKESRELLFNHFRIFSDYKIDLENKIIPNHRTDITITSNKDNIIAVEIVDTNMKIESFQNILSQYKEMNIKSTWFMIDKVINNTKFEYNLEFIKRFQLNELQENSLIIIDKETQDMAIYRHDNFEYKYKNKEGQHHFNTNIFQYKFNLNNLKIKDNRILIDGFDIEHQKWLDKRNQELTENDQVIKKIEEIIPQKNNLELSFTDHNYLNNQINNNNPIKNKLDYANIKRQYNTNLKVIEKNIIYELDLIIDGNQYAKNMILKMMEFNKNYITVINIIKRELDKHIYNENYLKLINEILQDWEEKNL